MLGNRHHQRHHRHPFYQDEISHSLRILFLYCDDKAAEIPRNISRCVSQICWLKPGSKPGMNLSLIQILHMYAHCICYSKVKWYRRELSDKFGKNMVTFIRYNNKE